MIKQINWFALVGGILILTLLLVSFYFPWWQLVIGDNLFKVNVSPVNTNVGVLGSQFTVPLIWAMNIASILTFLASGIIMLIYAVKPTRPYSQDLLSFGYRKPLYAVIFCVVGLLIAVYVVQAAVGISVPLVGAGTIVLPSSLMPMGIGAQGDGHRNRTRPHRKRQGQWIKRIVEGVLGLDVLLPSLLRDDAALFEQRPARGDHNQTSTYLDDGQRNAKEREDVRSDKVRANQEEEGVHCNSPGQRPAGT